MNVRKLARQLLSDAAVALGTLPLAAASEFAIDIVDDNANATP